MAALCDNASRSMFLKFGNSGKQKFYSTVVLIALILVAGPELGLGLEVIALIDLFGLELLILCFTAPLWSFWYVVQAWLSKVDPYYFIPSAKQVSASPGLLAHAIPGYLPMLFWAVGISVVVS
jgi:hypothetical protein